MFWVINKDKVVSYLVTLSVVGVLFAFAAFMPKDSMETSANIINNVENAVCNYVN